MHLNNSEIIKESKPINKDKKQFQQQINAQKSKSSLMAMMKEIMQRSHLCTDQLHDIAQESHQCSQSMIIIEEKQTGKQLIPQNKKRHQSVNFQHQQHFQTYIQEKNIKSSCIFNKSKQTNQTTQKISCQQIPQKNISLDQTQSYSSTDSDFSKLIEITSRCVQYYNKFVLEKSMEFQIIQKTFHDLNFNLNNAFGQIVLEATKKHNELQDFLSKKYKEIISLKNIQNEKLKNTLEEIKEIHLTNLLQKKQNQSQYKEQKGSSAKTKFLSVSSIEFQKRKTLQNYPKKSYQSFTNLNEVHQQQKNSSFSFELQSYANTLNVFYRMMQDIQKSNFKQMVEQSVSFISNLITEQIKSVLYEKIPLKLVQKRMVRQLSKDFLLESNQNSIEVNKTPHSQNNLLDADSFTKLFLESSKVQFQSQKLFQNINVESHGQTHKKFEDDLKNLNIIHQFNSQKNINSQSNKKNRGFSNVKYNPEQEDIFQKQIKASIKGQKINNQNWGEKIKTIELNNQTSCRIKEVKVVSSHDLSPKINLQINSTLKNELNRQSLSPRKNLQGKSSKLQKQNQIDLIKKISNQQSNRSAKIKNYLINFEDPKIQENQVKKIENLRSQNKASKTPKKINKSTYKKIQTGNNRISSSKCSHPSLKTSRNQAQVSQFKILTVNNSKKNSISSFK